jgi:DNA-binding beta-propeller fold protein YncE
VIPSSGVIVVSDTLNNCIRLVTPLGVVTTLAGGNGGFADGTGAAAGFNQPKGVAVIPSSGVVVVADSQNHRIRLVTPLGVVTTLAGSGRFAFADGAGAAASFWAPMGVALSTAISRISMSSA